MSILAHSGVFAGGLLLLLLGGKLLVDAAVNMAARLGVSPLLVGLTVVAWGTSAPELAFNTTSAIKGHTDLVFGNLVGANICNIGLILGVCALIRPLGVGDAVIRRELPAVGLTMVIMLAMALFGPDGFVRWEGLLLLTGFLLYAGLTILGGVREHPRKTKLDEQVEHKHEQTFERSLASAIAGFLGGLILLGVGGTLAADGATGAATLLGVSPTVVGLTVVSIGTTLPELITGVVAVRKGHVDLAVGNVVGSCMFNIGCTFGLAAAISPIPVPEHGILSIIVMSGLCVVLMIMARTTNNAISRIEGTMLLVVYAAFVSFQVFAAAGESAGVDVGTPEAATLTPPMPADR
jgi:cation:H+ antiporter